MGIETVALETTAADGYVVMACASGSGLRAMADLGQPLMSADEQAAAGLRVFDTVAARSRVRSLMGRVLQ